MNKYMTKSAVAFFASIIITCVGYGIATLSPEKMFNSVSSRIALFFGMLLINAIIIAVFFCILFKNECEQEYQDRKAELTQLKLDLKMLQHKLELKNVNSKLDMVEQSLDNINQIITNQIDSVNNQIDMMNDLVEKHKKANDNLERLIGR